MLVHRAHDRLAVAHRRRHFVEIMRRKSAAEIDHLQLDARLLKAAEQRGRLGDRRIPLLRVGLLRADVKRDAVRLQAVIPGPAQQALGDLDLAAEFLRQRPIGPFALRRQSAEDPALGRGARQFLQLALAVEREQVDAGPLRAGDVLLFLDGMTEGHAAGIDLQARTGFHLGHARDVEEGSFLGQGPDDCVGRVRFYRIVDVDIRQRVLQRLIAFDDKVEVKHQKRGLGPRLREKLRYFFAHTGSAERPGLLPVTLVRARASTQRKTGGMFGRQTVRAARRPLKYRLGLCPRHL